MNGITAAFIAQIFIGISLVIDKIFFGDNRIERAVPYVFWIAILSCFGLVFFFFGFKMPGARTLGLAFAAALSFILMLVAYYRVLAIGEATEAVPVVGGFAPLATWLAGSMLQFSPLNAAESAGFALLILGGFILFFSERSRLKELLPWTLLAAALTGSTNILEKLVFLNTMNFATGYALMKTFTLMTGIMMLAVPRLRRNIFSESRKTTPRRRVLYFVNRAAAGTGSLLIFYAIKLESSPAIVEAINGTRYVIVFMAAFAVTAFIPGLLNETMKGWRVFAKLTATLLIITGLTGLGLQRWYEKQPVPGAHEVVWGVTFSEFMADKLEIDTAEALKAIVYDLRPSGVRLVAYWNRIEKETGRYDFSRLDMQMDICRKAGMPVILVIGQRVPRWPECHIPVWANPKHDLPAYLAKIVERYKGYENLKYWQLENEPYLLFGECPPSDSGLIRKEISLLRSLDPSRKILMTDGGEFGDWYRASSLCDLFGTTLYRKVRTRFFGEVTYPLTPEFYPLKRDIVKFLTGRHDQEFIVIELGVEPWAEKQIYEMPPQEQVRNFTIAEFEANIDYALRCRFSSYYLWGVEWWYYLKVRHGINGYWEYASSLTKKDAEAETGY